MSITTNISRLNSSIKLKTIKMEIRKSCYTFFIYKEITTKI